MALVGIGQRVPSNIRGRISEVDCLSCNEFIPYIEKPLTESWLFGIDPAPRRFEPSNMRKLDFYSRPHDHLPAAKSENRLQLIPEDTDRDILRQREHHIVLNRRAVLVLINENTPVTVAARNDVRSDARFRAVSNARSVRLERAADADSVRLSA